MQTKEYLILVDLLKETDYNTKITEIECKIPSISGLAANAALSALKIKYLISVIQSRKKNHAEKILDIKRKYITTADYNKFTKNIAASSIKSKNLVDKCYVSEFVNNADLDKKRYYISSKS